MSWRFWMDGRNIILGGSQILVRKKEHNMTEQKRTGAESLQEVSRRVLAKQDREPLMRSTEHAQPKKPPACPLCNGFGWLSQDLPVSHPDFGRMVRCGCKAVEDSERLRAVTGLTPVELMVTF